MATLDHSSLPQATLNDLRQTLRHLNSPTKLAHSPWLASAAVAQRQQARSELSPAQALCTLLNEVLTTLSTQQPLYADLLRGRFWEGLTVAEMLAYERPQAQSERRFHQQQEEALIHFTRLLAEQETHYQRHQAATTLRQRLPLPTYDTLLGVDALIDQTLYLLHSPDRYFIISLKGIGGIGKTALADYVVRRLLESDHRLVDLIWITAKQEHITPAGIHRLQDNTQVRLENLLDELGWKLGITTPLPSPLAQKVAIVGKRLRGAPYLVVIDNLETIEDFRRLVPWLAQLTDPTKFLLTSRESVPALTSVSTVELTELDQAASMALAQQVARTKAVADCDPEWLYTVVGGNPLAIILAVSQMTQIAPAVVLHEVSNGSTAAIYRYIYQRSWCMLQEAECEILLAIQRAGDRAEWTWLAMSSQLSEQALHQALQHLLDLSLVYLQRNEASERLYAIHRLTSTFLRTEVLGWK